MFPGSERRYRRRLRRRRRRAFALAVLLILAIAAYADIRAHRPTGSGPRPAQPKRPSSSTGLRPTTSHPGSPPRPNAFAQAGQELTWAVFHGIALPVSAPAGPHHTQDGLAWGFRDTPRGALLAAINIGVRTAALWGPSIYIPTINRQVTGPAKAALREADTSDYAALRAAADVQPGQPAGRGYAIEAAYRFGTWSRSRAVVVVVTEAPGTSGGTPVIAATRIEVRWLGGDWRVVAPPGGDWASTATRVTSLTGYMPFSLER